MNVSVGHSCWLHVSRCYCLLSLGHCRLMTVSGCRVLHVLCYSGTRHRVDLHPSLRRQASLLTNRHASCVGASTSPMNCGRRLAVVLSWLDVRRLLLLVSLYCRSLRL